MKVILSGTRDGTVIAGALRMLLERDREWYEAGGGDADELEQLAAELSDKPPKIRELKMVGRYELLLELMRKHRGNVTRVAIDADHSRKDIYPLLDSVGLNPEDFRPPIKRRAREYRRAAAKRREEAEANG